MSCFFCFAGGFRSPHGFFLLTPGLLFLSTLLLFLSFRSGCCLLLTTLFLQFRQLAKFFFLLRNKFRHERLLFGGERKFRRAIRLDQHQFLTG